MPTVIIRRNPDKMPDPFIAELVEILPKAVAENLTVPGTSCEVTESDVGVEVHDHGPLDKPTHDLEITIWAGNHKERSKNLHQRHLGIEEEVEVLLDRWGYGGSTSPGFVWILLAAKDAFGELHTPDM